VNKPPIRMRWWLLPLVWLLMQPLVQPLAAAPAEPILSAEVQRQIIQHGPWPPMLSGATAAASGNRLLGNPAAIALGERLFFDSRLAGSGELACASCHVPALAFTDGRARSFGRVEVDRNAPSLWNAGHGRWFGWDGAADSLWSQAIRALVDEREMASSGAHLRRTIAADATLAACWHRAVGSVVNYGNTGDTSQTTDTRRDEAVLVDVAKAIAAWVATQVSPRTPFDHFRDALMRGDRRAAARYPAAAQRGAALFVGRGRCHFCHAGPLFSNGEFADTGLPHFVRPGVVDSGRHGGIEALLASPYSLLSAWADAPVDSTKTRHVQATHRNFGEFKVPSLRGVALTAPYMHNGSLPTLDDVLRHYSQLNIERLHADGERILEPLHLSAGELHDLRAFLHTLTPIKAATTAPTPVMRPKRSSSAGQHHCGPSPKGHRGNTNRPAEPR
jgi:cytochrome c peroxidase